MVVYKIVLSNWMESHKRTY